MFISMFLLDRIFFYKVRYVNKFKYTYAYLLNPFYLFFLLLHIRLSSLTTATQLVDIAYLPSMPLSLWYNFFNFNGSRIFIFVPGGCTSSVASLFFSANWLEREAAEMSGCVFWNKCDTRNLLLLFADCSAPGRKEFPVIGLREISYHIVVDSLLWTPVTYQF